MDEYVWLLVTDTEKSLVPRTRCARPKIENDKTESIIKKIA